MGSNERKVWKFPLRLESHQEIEVPNGYSAEFLDAQMQEGQLVLWALVDTDYDKETTRVRLVDTGEEINESYDDLEYVKTWSTSRPCRSRPAWSSTSSSTTAMMTAGTRLTTTLTMTTNESVRRTRRAATDRLRHRRRSARPETSRGSCAPRLATLGQEWPRVVSKEDSMGTYINPPTVSKEEWLRQHATRVTEEHVRTFRFNEQTVVVAHLDNGEFTAALVCDTPHELAYIHGRLYTETRRVSYYVVGAAEAREVST